MKTVQHRIFYPNGTYEDTTREVPNDYLNVPPRTYTPLELAQQDITDRELDTIELGQSMTDLELMIMEGYHV